MSKGTAVDEGALPIGSHAASPDEVTKGTVHIEAKDGVQTITIGGTPIDLNNPTATTVTGTFGKLEITGWDPTTGDLTYTYTLTKNDPNHPNQGVDSKLDETFPALKLRWSVREGIEELAGAYARYGLTYEDFTSSRFVRLRRIRELLTAGTVDEMLRRTAPRAG